MRKLLNSFGTANFWKRLSVANAFLFAFITSAGQVPLFACSCVGGGDGLFIMNRETDDKTLTRISHNGIISRAASPSNTFISMIWGDQHYCHGNSTGNWTPIAAIRL